MGDQEFSQVVAIGVRCHVGIGWMNWNDVCTSAIVCLDPT